jgi:hypothetical protein
LAIVSGSTPAWADAAEVEALIAKGNELRRKGTPGPALPYFQKAYELARTPRTTGQLGLAELAAGYPVEAAEHLATALESGNDPSIVKYRQMLADALTMARSQIGELSVQGSPTGAEVVIDGRKVGALPLASPIKLAAHNTEVLVRAPGYSDQRQFVPIAGGQRHQVTMNLEKAEKPAEPAPAVTVAPTPPAPAAATPPAATVVEQRPADGAASGAGLRMGAWLAGGGALVAVGTGVALQLVAGSKLSDFDAGCRNDPTMGPIPDAPPNVEPLTQKECVDRYDTWQSYRRWSLVGYAAGAALAVTSGILFWTSRPAAPHTLAHFQCAPSTNGIACHGVF